MSITRRNPVMTQEKVKVDEPSVNVKSVSSTDIPERINVDNIEIPQKKQSVVSKVASTAGNVVKDAACVGAVGVGVAALGAGAMAVGSKHKMEKSIDNMSNDLYRILAEALSSSPIERDIILSGHNTSDKSKKSEPRRLPVMPMPSFDTKKEKENDSLEF